MSSEISESELNRIIVLITERLPKNSKLLLLSNTGSRPFGWASSSLDWDIHGVFAKKSWWDYVHHGANYWYGLDINLWELDHLYTDVIYGHWQMFMNLSNPIYISKEFPFDDLIQWVFPHFFRDNSAVYQLDWALRDKAVRSFLHAYRIPLQMLEFLNTNKWEMDIPKLVEKYIGKNSKFFELKNAYQNNISQYVDSNTDLDQIKAEIENIINSTKSLRVIKETEKPFNRNEFDKWWEKKIVPIWEGTEEDYTY